MKVPNETWKSGCMATSSGPLPLLLVWAMASSRVVAGVGFEGGHGRGRQGCTYCIDLFLLLVVLFHWWPTGRYLMNHGGPDV